MNDDDAKIEAAAKAVADEWEKHTDVSAFTDDLIEQVGGSDAVLESFREVRHGALQGAEIIPAAGEVHAYYERDGLMHATPVQAWRYMDAFRAGTPIVVDDSGAVEATLTDDGMVCVAGPITSAAMEYAHSRIRRTEFMRELRRLNHLRARYVVDGQRHRPMRPEAVTAIAKAEGAWDLSGCDKGVEGDVSVLNAWLEAGGLDSRAVASPALAERIAAQPSAGRQAV